MTTKTEEEDSFEKQIKQQFAEAIGKKVEEKIDEGVKEQTQKYKQENSYLKERIEELKRMLQKEDLDIQKTEKKRGAGK